MPSKQGQPGRKPFLLAPYVFGIQTVPLLASGIYTLLYPAAAASLPDSPLQGLSNGTIQALRYKPPKTLALVNLRQPFGTEYSRMSVA